MEWTTVASLAFRVGAASVTHRHFIQGWWKKCLAYMERGDTNVLVTGRPNVGKTVLVSQMLGDAKDAYYSLPKESRTVEVNAVTIGAWAHLVRTLPGQSSQIRTDGMNEAFGKNPNLSGVIHVVDFGYTAPRDPAIAQGLIKENSLDTIEKLRDYNLTNEIDEVKNLLVSIERAIPDERKSLFWLVIAVNKIDLFKERLDEALLFYHPEGNSGFSKALAAVQKRVGSNSLKIYVVSTCAYEVDFLWNGITVKSGLSVQEQRVIVREFMETVASISET